MLIVRRSWLDLAVMATLAFSALGCAAMVGGPLAVAVVLGAMIAGVIVTPKVSIDTIMKMRQARRAEDNWWAIDAMIRGLAQRASLPDVPRLYRIPGPSINAFAVRNGNQSGIALTDGIVKLLDDRELTSVIAHELGHIAARDTDFLRFGDVVIWISRAAVVTGLALALATYMTIPNVTINPYGAFILATIPFAMEVILLSYSRHREYEADAFAARLVGDGLGLASALSKIERLNKWSLTRIGKNVRQILPPAFLRTHPDSLKRIKKLVDIAGVGISQSLRPSARQWNRLAVYRRPQPQFIRRPQARRILLRF